MVAARTIDKPAAGRHGGCAIASRLGKTPAQVILRWHVEHGLIVIPKSAASAERLRQNFEIFGFTLEADDNAALDGLDRGTPAFYSAQLAGDQD